MYLDRYLRGEHVAVWQELIDMGEQVREDHIYEEAEAVARQLMLVVRENLERLVDRLDRFGYRFGERANGEPTRHFEGPMMAPVDDVDEKIRELEVLAGGPLPMSLAAFWRTVGSVEFTGYHSAWPAYSDELIIYPIEAAFESHSEWLECCENDGIEIVGPLRIALAPDHWHKAQVSGAGSYVMYARNPMIDGAIWLGEHRPRPMFVEYLRDAIRWCGFPGFAEEPAGFSKELQEIASSMKDF